MHWLGITLIKTPRDFIDEHGRVIDMAGDDDALPGSRSTPAPPPFDDQDDDVPF
jgi:hypothetical protein